MIIDGMSGRTKEAVFEAIKENKDNIKSGNYCKLYSSLMSLGVTQIGAITELLCKVGGLSPQEIINSLKERNLPSGMFYHNDMNEITLPTSIDHIFYSCFYGSKVEKVNIKSKILYIGPRAFTGCKNLKEFDFNTCSTRLFLARKSFAHSGLEKIDLPTCTQAESTCFSDCNNLKEVIIQADKHNFTRIDGNYANAFANTALDKFTIKSAVLELIIGHEYTGELSSADGVKIINYFGFIPGSNGCDIGVI